MKIIGRGEEGVYLLLAREVEVANLMGYSSSHHYERDLGVNLPAVGDEIMVSVMFEKVGALRAHAESVVMAQKALRSVADIMEPLTDVVVRVTTPVVVEVGDAA